MLLLFLLYFGDYLVFRAPRRNGQIFIFCCHFIISDEFMKNKTEKPFSLQEDEKIDMADKNRIPKFIFDYP